MTGQTIPTNQLPQATLPVSPNDSVTVSQDGTTLSQTTVKHLAAAPNNKYAGDYSTTNPPPSVLRNPNSASFSNTLPFNYALESSNIYWASDGSGNGLFITGYEDTF